MKIFEKLGVDKKHIVQTSVQALAYGNSSIKVIGEIILKSKVKESLYDLEYLIVDVDDELLLGRITSVKLNLIQRVNKVMDILKNYADVFKGIGAFKKKYKFKLRKDAEPVICKLKRVSDVIRDKLKRTLKRYEDAGIISRINGPTEWVNNITIAEKKNGKLRICLFPLELNEALVPDTHPIPTINEITSKLKNKNVFTVMDVREAFFHIPLEPESSEMTTFITPFGKFIFNYMPQGVNIAAEVFQRYIEEAFENIDISIYFDDIIIAAETEEEHDRILKKVLDRAREHNVRFNIDKIQYKTTKVKYLGLLICKLGIEMDKEYIEAIKNLGLPQT